MCDPSRLALLVYDMQVGIVGQLKGCEAVTARVSRVLEAARRAGLRIFYTRHMSLPKELMGAFQYRMAWQRVDDPSKVEPWFLRVDEVGDGGRRRNGISGQNQGRR